MPREDRKQVPRDIVCTCKTCNHGIARDCEKLGCTCCTKEDHSMVLDGMIGYGPLSSRKT